MAPLPFPLSVRAAALISLLALTAAVPYQSDNPPPANQLGQDHSTDHSTDQPRLDAVERQLAQVQGGLRPFCDVSPCPVPDGQDPSHKPAAVACARSCKELQQQGGSHQDGVYWFTGMPVPVFCDFSHDGGGWTLLLTATSRDGWDSLAVMARNEGAPSLTDNYSILRHADAIRDLGTGSMFFYRLEALAEHGRQRWGGVWQAPRSYSFLAQTNTQTDVTLLRKFDNWDYKNDSIEKRMPWLNTGNGDALLTTSSSAAAHWWGTLVTKPYQTEFHHSPWINHVAINSGTVLYWGRE